MEMQRAPCATSPFVSRTSCTTTVPLRAAQTICHGAPPQQTTTKTRNMASVQVNVRLVNYATWENKENICFGAVKSPRHNSHPDSSLHIWRKCRWREMCLSLHLFGQGIWQLHRRGPHRWIPLVCYHNELRPGPEIWLLSQQRYVTEKRLNKCIVYQSLIVLTGHSCDLEQIRLLSVGILKESSATSPSCSSAKSMIPAPVRADQTANCGAVPLQTMIRTRNGACVLTKVRATSKYLR